MDKLIRNGNILAGVLTLLVIGTVFFEVPSVVQIVLWICFIIFNIALLVVKYRNAPKSMRKEYILIGGIIICIGIIYFF